MTPQNNQLLQFGHFIYCILNCIIFFSANILLFGWEGFWSILVLSVLAGSICAVFSWIITYLDSYQLGKVPPTLLALFHFR